MAHGLDTALIHHLRDISLLYLSAHSSLHPSASGYITVATPPPTSQPLPRTSTSIHPADGLHSSNSSAEAGSSQSGSSFIHVPHPHLRRSRSKPSLDVARSNVTASTSAGGSTLRTGEKAAFLSAADLDGDEAEGEDAWAEGGSWWHGVGADQVDEVREGIRALETMLASGKLKSGDTQVCTSAWSCYLRVPRPLIALVCPHIASIPSPCRSRARGGDQATRHRRLESRHSARRGGCSAGENKREVPAR